MTGVMVMAESTLRRLFVDVLGWLVSLTKRVNDDGEWLLLNIRDVLSGRRSFIRNSLRVLSLSSFSVRVDWQNGSWD